MKEHNENFNIEKEKIRKYRTEVTELKNATTKLKNKLEGFSSRLDAGQNRSATWKTEQ